MTPVRRGGRAAAPAPRSGGTATTGPGSPGRSPAPVEAPPRSRGPVREPRSPSGGSASGTAGTTGTASTTGLVRGHGPSVPTARSTGAAGRVPAPAAPPEIEASPAAPSPPPTGTASADAAVRALVGLGADAPGRAVARDRVVATHLPLVQALARRYTGRGEPFDDLVQVGTIGLLTAVDRYDPARGVPLGAFAVPHVLGEIRRHFRDRGWAVRVPRRLQEHGRAVAEARAALTQTLGRSPTVAEVARTCDLDADLVVAALESAGAYATVPLEEDERAGTERLGGRLATEDAGLADVEDRLLLRPLLDALPARERRILALRFVRGLSQSEIAAEVGISQVHVSRLLARTLATLRDQLEG